ncbi:FAD-dependent oxidoreductase [Aquabacterium sp. J223]|uniref:FAD-dependent oxidoreductase n=1 Tax=Aquabacterium sp. J223 TaxID=2898431 RepID=UPI0021AD9AF2|nr:FAD-dependent oxidoreductase [Aquabacterium sp. J223]UUX93989.1 FAD-dependent oxidoreductase [Aquabacterium sp. J223]
MGAGAKQLRTQVVIVGAGPVGLLLATDLAKRGIRTVVMELRGFMEPPSVKCNHVSARTMEQLRRLGLAETVRSTGLPTDHSNDIAFRLTTTGVELSRVHIPGRADRYTDTTGPDGWWPTPEPPHRINQRFLEPLLARHAASLPEVTLINACEFTGFTENSQGIVAQAHLLGSGQALEISGSYIVGCDGARSTLRRAIGAVLEGTAVIQHVQSTLIKAPALLGRLGERPAWAYYSLNSRRCGTVFAIDGTQEWLVHNHLDVEEAEAGNVDRHASIRAILGVDEDFQYEVLSHEDWIARRLVADRFRNGRAFICGDAAHLWIPQAGYGMNAGIADCLDLSWMLAATLQGWASPDLLDAYEAERLPITNQASHFAMNHGLQKIKMRHSLPPALEEDSPAGALARAEVGSRVYDLNVRQFCCAGLNFGYYYDASPVIVYDGEAPPPYGMDTFTPSIVPGCRMPHFWLPDGRSVYDALGDGYTLVQLDRRADAAAAALLQEAERQGMPMTRLHIGRDGVPDVYTSDLLICRPDQHVAWRSGPARLDAAKVVATLRGDAAGPPPG